MFYLPQLCTQPMQNKMVTNIIWKRICICFFSFCECESPICLAGCSLFISNIAYIFDLIFIVGIRLKLPIGSSILISFHSNNINFMLNAQREYAQKNGILHEPLFVRGMFYFNVSLLQINIKGRGIQIRREKKNNISSELISLLVGSTTDNEFFTNAIMVGNTFYIHFQIKLH